MKYTHIFERKDSNYFGKEASLFGVNVDGESVTGRNFEIPEKAEFIQFRIRKTPSENSLPLRTFDIFFKEDFEDNRRPKDGHVELLWW